MCIRMNSLFRWTCSCCWYLLALKHLKINDKKLFHGFSALKFSCGLYWCVWCLLLMRVKTQISEETIFSNELCRFIYWLHAKAIISVTKVWLEWRKCLLRWFTLRWHTFSFANNRMQMICWSVIWTNTNCSSAFHCTNILNLLFRPLHPYLSNWFVIHY